MCIWETPTWAAISVWVSPPKNRSSRIRRSRSGNAASSGARPSRCSTRSNSGSVCPSAAANRGRSSVPSPSPCRAGRPGKRCAPALGGQPLQDDLDVQVEVSGDLARPGGAAVPLGEFGGGVVDHRLQLAQAAGRADRGARSRKCRSSSPVIVGTAKDRKSMPRPGSKRSTARINPTDATCSRSSAARPGAVLAGDVPGDRQVPGDQLVRAAARGAGRSAAPPDVAASGADAGVLPEEV